MEFKLAEQYQEGLLELLSKKPLSENFQDRLIFAMGKIVECEGSIPISNWCPQCLMKISLIMRTLRAERKKSEFGSGSLPPLHPNCSSLGSDRNNLDNGFDANDHNEDWKK